MEPQPQQQLTVKQLITFLEAVLKKNPDARVFHVEFGGLTRTTLVEKHPNGVVIS